MTNEPLRMTSAGRRQLANGPPSRKAPRVQLDGYLVLLALAMLEANHLATCAGCGGCLDERGIAFPTSDVRAFVRSLFTLPFHAGERLD